MTPSLEPGPRPSQTSAGRPRPNSSLADALAASTARPKPQEFFLDGASAERPSPGSTPAPPQIGAVPALTPNTLHAPPLYLEGHRSGPQRPRAPGGREPVAVLPFSQGPAEARTFPPPPPQFRPRSPRPNAGDAWISGTPTSEARSPSPAPRRPERRRLPPEGSQSILPRCLRDDRHRIALGGLGGRVVAERLEGDVIYPRRLVYRGCVCNLQRQG